MNKKILIVAALLMVVCVGGAFAWGIGIQGGGGYPGAGNVAVTFKLDSLPLVFATNLYIRDSFTLGLSADYWFLNNNIVGPLNWFIGAGLGANLGFPVSDDGNFVFDLGLRVPVGLNMYLVDGFIEPYVQAVPAIGMDIVPFKFPTFRFDGNIGIRFWF